MPDQLPTPQESAELSDIDARLQAIQARAAQGQGSNIAANSGYAPVQPVELLSWSSDSRVFSQKSPQWFLGLFAVALVGVILLAVIQEFMLILVVVALVFVYYALARVEPAEVEHSIYNSGVKTAGRMYTWKELRSFWIYSKIGQTILRLDTKMHFAHTVEILLADTPRQEVEKLLQQHLPEQEKAVSETGALADNTFISIANRMPYKDKLLNFVETNTGYIHFDQPKPVTKP
jgi:hypothetical protein